MEKQVENFAFSEEKLKNVAEQYREKYKKAHPFPHTVIDGLADSEFLHKVAQSLPTPGSETERNNPTTQGKTAYADQYAKRFSPEVRQLITELNSGAFITFLEQLTGIKGLIPDPHLEGGGVHQIRRGGFLKVHADFNWNARLKLDRRVNVLLYLNEDWKPEYGGQLELWDTKMSKCEQKILPLFNKMVVFNTTDKSFHGHPDPLQCPETRTRNSIAMYYYSNGRPSEERRFGRNLMTLYRERPGEDFQHNRIRHALKHMVPKWIYDLRSALSGV